MWGKAIVASFVFFALFIGSLVYVCVRQDIALVSTSYYKEELEYQDQIDRISNVAALPEKPSINQDHDNLVLTYTNLPSITEGEIKLFRPSDETLDRSYEVVPGNVSNYVIDLKNIVSGLYKVKFTWKEAGKEFYYEQTVVI